MLHIQTSELAVQSHSPAHSETCEGAGLNSQPAPSSLVNDPAVQVALHNLNFHLRNIDKIADDLVLIAETKVMGRVPNFRFVDDEPAVTAMEPIGTVTDRMLGDVLRNMNNRQAYKPTTPWTYNVAGEIFDASAHKLGKMDTRAAAHVVALVNGGAK